MTPFPTFSSSDSIIPFSADPAIDNRSAGQKALDEIILAATAVAKELVGAGIISAKRAAGYSVSTQYVTLRDGTGGVIARTPDGIPVILLANGKDVVYNTNDIVQNVSVASILTPEAKIGIAVALAAGVGLVLWLVLKK